MLRCKWLVFALAICAFSFAHAHLAWCENEPHRPTDEEYQARKANDALIPTCNVKPPMCGYVDQGGKSVIEPQFDWADRFLEGRAVVVESGKYGVIDQTGKVIVAVEQELIGRFENGQAKILVGDKLGVIDLDGNWVLQPEYGKIVQIGENAYLVAEPPYAENHARGFEQLDNELDRMLPYAYGKKWGIVTKRDTWIMQPRLLEVSLFSKDLRDLFWAKESRDGGWRLTRRSKRRSHFG